MNKQSLNTAALLAAASLTVMANATISPALPAMRDHFADVNSITTLIGLVMTLPSLAVALFAAPLGLLADRVGKWRLLLVALSVYAAGGLSGGLAGSFDALLVSRLVLGLGVAGVMTASTAIAADLYDGAARERFLGQQGAAQSMGGIVFLLAGGMLATIGWRWPFLLYGLAAVVWLLVWRAAPAKLPLVQVPGGVTATDGKLPQELPMRPLAVLAGLACFSMVAFYIVPTQLPFLLRDMGHTAPWLGGVAVASTTLGAAVTSLNFRKLRLRWAEPALTALLLGLMAAGYALIALTAVSPDFGLALVFSGAAVAGFGLGGIMPLLSSALFKRIPAERRGAAAGALTSAVFAGQFASPLASGPVAQALGLAAAFSIFAAVLALVAVAIGLLAHKLYPIEDAPVQ